MIISSFQSVKTLCLAAVVALVPALGSAEPLKDSLEEGFRQPPSFGEAAGLLAVDQRQCHQGGHHRGSGGDAPGGDQRGLGPDGGRRSAGADAADEPAVLRHDGICHPGSRAPGDDDQHAQQLGLGRLRRAVGQARAVDAVRDVQRSGRERPGDVQRQAAAAADDSTTSTGTSRCGRSRRRPTREPSSRPTIRCRSRPMRRAWTQPPWPMVWGTSSSSSPPPAPRSPTTSRPSSPSR